MPKIVGIVYPGDRPEPPTGPRNTELRTLADIAQEIYFDWGVKVTPSAKPYLDAMRHLGGLDSYYGVESAHEIVCRFLINASQWRGPKARAIKAELKRMFKS